MGSLGSPQHKTTHHIIVVPEGRYCPIPDLVFPEPYTYEPHNHFSTPQDKIVERIRPATILILSAVPFSDYHLSAECTPNLQMIAVMASGTDHLNLDICRKRGITVSNARSANVAAVSEHAVGLYFAARRKFRIVERAMRAGEWMKGSCHPLLLDSKGENAPTCGEEVLGVVGYGRIGQRIAEMGRMLGMKVLVAERKGAETIRDGRMEFGDVLKQATVIVLILPKTEDTIYLISTAELGMMKPQSILINVSRGGIVDEEALVQALKAGQIAGAAVDVFSEEPAGPDNSVLAREDTRNLNLILTPHVAWVAETTTTNVKLITKQNIEGWLAGRPVNVVT
ncbi:glycerate dehydrogenase [Teratosphaeria nubilosa]|uniref:Glycerate dehydrogenase n=1 Tax=Teratosphaeria nubilosa TaxID=161662 RepID=A0A6G1LK79_9PEZI|nr:glycerate dehydrogenase [Teratosphaeria nubilosa]